MPKAAAGALALALVLPAITSAQPPQSLKPGLWKMVTQIVVQPAFPNMPGAQSGQICISGPLKPEDMLARRRPEQSKGNCTTLRSEQTPGGRVRETSCVVAGHTYQTMMTTTGSETHFDGTTTTVVDGAPTLTGHSTWDWVGECPSGMKVGQFQLSATP